MFQYFRGTSGFQRSNRNLDTPLEYLSMSLDEQEIADPLFVSMLLKEKVTRKKDY